MRSFACDYHPENYVETNLEGITLQIKEDFGARDIHLRIISVKTKELYGWDKLENEWVHTGKQESWGQNLAVL